MHSVEYGSGTPLLLIHGFCLDHRLLLGLDPVFAAGGWRRVYLDLPGMGRSAAGPGINGSDSVAEAVVDFVRKTFGQEKFAVLGNSFGGMIARQLVAEFGDQILGLALLCPVAVAEHSSRDVPAQTVLHADPVLLAGLDQWEAAEYQSMAVVQSPENWILFRDAVLPGPRAFDPAAIERISSTYSLAVEPEARSAPFPGPTLIITGRQDHVVGFRDHLALLDHYVHATFIVLDRAGHNAHLDQPELTEALLAEWLGRMVEKLAATPSETLLH
ncbi:alpha/beta hydrolase [Arthrobacter jiangjiafuii]|uniref:Alpha/beta hydrolase n=1 Tax=Arthrobacter jiangjiafuii TaxID=2817475 RepID=A0A975R0P4_9MICC|nr:alpha/beta fold hydrolase [Arthrobacter jiangjiafuii]MBP3044165.1 alpha/beta fold hydrolase [Arthrobacter jiangjiafuii]QWC11135.1 alpha/beta hydrolase [Arthrobacter jiangjiafuii]